jgi:hypothetical protein
MRTVSLLVTATALALTAHVAAQQPATKRIRGDIVAIEGTKLQVRTREGPVVDIDLDEKYTVTAVVKMEPSAIARGSFVGTASMPEADGTLRALEVLVFPESARGSGEGHYPWDLQPGSMMTNATVAEVVDVGAGRRMTLRYKDGEKVVTVPPAAPVVTFQPGGREMVVPGAHLILTATVRPDGTLAATRMSVGKDGLVPPM